MGTALYRRAVGYKTLRAFSVGCVYHVQLVITPVEEEAIVDMSMKRSDDASPSQIFT